MPRSISTSVIAPLILAAALIVPAAQAQPIDPPTAGEAAQPATAQLAEVQHGLTSTYAADASASGARAATPASAPTANGFSWGDAGIGAGAMLVLVALGTGAFLGLGRTRLLGHRQAQEVGGSA